MRKEATIVATAALAAGLLTSCGEWLPSFETISRSQIQQTLQKAGMTAEDRTEEGKLPSLQVKARDGNLFGVLLFNCQTKSPNRTDGCSSIQLRACWQTTVPGDRYWDALEYVNGFNRSSSLWSGRAILLGARDRLRAGGAGHYCHIQILRAAGGISDKAILASIDNFLLSVDGFRNHMRFGPPTTY